MTAVALPEIGDLYRKHFGSGRASMGSLLGGMTERESNGAWITVDDGQKYLDFGGYGVFLLGHRHPRVVAAVRRQLEVHPMASRVFFEPVAARAAAALASVTPDGLDFVHFVNSGAEATEAAIKLARANGKTALITTENGFHGKTMGALSVTARSVFQDPFRPLLPDVTTVPYGDVRALEPAFEAAKGRGCFIVEPVQGEGGVRIPPSGYLRAAAQLCAEYDILLVVDEIQSGLGRLGSWWGVDHDGVTPDIMLVGKGLSGGVIPIAAMVATEKAYAPFSKDPYLHTSTFAASPIACAAAEATIGVMVDDDIPSRAGTLGERLTASVAEIFTARPQHVAQVRGRGLLIGVEFAEPALVGESFLGLVEGGVLANHSLNSSHVLRFTPPAVLTEDDITLFLTVLRDVVEALPTI